MTEITDEKLSAFLDGELPDNVAAEIEKALETDEALALRLEQLSGVDDLLRGAVDVLENQMRPQSGSVSDTQPAIDPVSKVVKIPPQAANDNWWRLPLTASVALVIGVITGGTLFNTGSTVGPNADGGVRLASYTSETSLGGFLETAASGEQLAIGDGQAEMRFTFLGSEGLPCREFAVTTEASTTQAVACRATENTWSVEIAAKSAVAGSSNDTGYQTASAGDEGFGEAVSAMMRSDAFSAEDEADLISNGWAQ